MVTRTEMKAYRAAFTIEADRNAPLGGTARLHMTLWSMFFALAAIGGLMS